MGAELAEAKSMWEMAATLDFLNLFRWVGGWVRMSVGGRGVHGWVGGCAGV